MNFIRGIWAWYLARKLWQKIAIPFLVIGIMGAVFGEDPETQKSQQASSASVSPSATASSTPTPSATSSSTATPTPTPTPVSGVELRSSALGDLADMRKDISDAKKRINEGGILRLYGNALELSFNIGQLKSLTVSPYISEKWNAYLTDLETSVDQFTDGLGSDSSAKSKSRLDKVLSAISKLESFVKTVK